MYLSAYFLNTVRGRGFVRTSGGRFSGNERSPASTSSSSGHLGKLRNICGGKFSAISGESHRYLNRSQDQRIAKRRHENAVLHVN